LALLEISPGCSSLIGVTLEAGSMFVPGFAPPSGPNSHRTGKNHYEPMILYSTKDWIRIKYLSVGPNAEHEKVIQLIFEHCDGTYIETIRAELRGYTTVEAECAHGKSVPLPV
jgi:hypothetical protein